MLNRRGVLVETIRERWVSENTMQGIVRNERDSERVRDGTKGRIGASRVALPAYTEAELCGSARASLRLRAAMIGTHAGQARVLGAWVNPSDGEEKYCIGRGKSHLLLILFRSLI